MEAELPLMEVIQIYDTVKKTNLKVKVTKQIARRCKEDPAYTQALLSQIRGKNFGNKSFIKITPVASKVKNNDDEETEKDNNDWSKEETRDLFQAFNNLKSDCPSSEKIFWDETSQNPDENADDREKQSWTRYETLKFLKIYQRYKNSRSNYPFQKMFWQKLSEVLAEEGVYKDPDRLLAKWKNLMKAYRLYKSNAKTPSRFKYLNEVNCVLNDLEFPDPDPGEVNYEIGQTSKVERFWTGQETLKLIELYKKYQHQIETMPRKNTWDMIAADMTAEGFYRDSTKCHNKWKNLLRLYRKCSNGKQLYFWNEMNSIIGNESDVEDDDSQDFIVDNSVKDDVEEFQETNEDFDDDGEFEEIIIKTEDDYGSSWTEEEIFTLIEMYGKYHHLIEENSENDVWTSISNEMNSKNLTRPPDDYKKMWNALLEQYSNLQSEEHFPFLEQLKKVLTKTDNRQQNQLVHKNACECFVKKAKDKERRHVERMRVLKRKLDIEDRKVIAFEKYVKYLTEKEDS